MSANRSPEVPHTAIVVAARNEEACIRNLLASLSAQNYPHDKMEVLLGNDRSTDATGQIMEKWAEHFPKARVVHIEHTLPGLVGKANVLAQLCRLTDAPYLLFTDADCRLPVTWVEAMVTELRAHTRNPYKDRHIVTGFSVTRGNSAFDLMQGVDWVAALSSIHLLSKAGIPVTAMGNNMACTNGAYQASGGFEATGGSLTEDYALFRRILHMGGTFSHLANPSILIETAPQPTWDEWLVQRKRWFLGAIQLPWTTQLPFWFQVAFYPLLVLAGFVFGWQWAAFAWFYKVWFQSLLFLGYMARLRLWKLAFWVIPYDAFAAASSWVLVYSYLTQREVEWKGIRYRQGTGGYEPA